MSRKTDKRNNARPFLELFFAVIRFKLREQIAEKMFRENRTITISEVAEATGIARSVLSGLVNQRGYNTVTDNLDRLCSYFGCELDDLAEYVDVTTPTSTAEKTRASVPARKGSGRKPAT